MPRKTLLLSPGTSAGLPGFNEAAARCRGKLGRQPPLDVALVDASMRPRPDAAENAQRPDDGGRGQGRLQ